jgi:hypothetical protein
MMLVVLVPVIVVTPVVAFASFASAIPVMVVLNPSMLSVPVAHVILATVVARANPRRAFIGRPGPIAFVPSVAAAIRIPIPVYPIVVRARRYRSYANHPVTRWLTNPDSHGYLSVNRRRPHHKNQDKQRRKNKFLHIRFPLLKWNTLETISLSGTMHKKELWLKCSKYIQRMPGKRA